MTTGSEVLLFDLFSDQLAGPAKLRREILKLREPVAHRQDSLGVVDVHARLEGEARECGGEYVAEPERRVVGHQVPAALLAVLALAQRRFLEGRDMLGPGRDPHGAWLPQAEGVHRPARPRPAGSAM